MFEMDIFKSIRSPSFSKNKYFIITKCFWKRNLVPSVLSLFFPQSQGQGNHPQASMVLIPFVELTLCEITREWFQ